MQNKYKHSRNSYAFHEMNQDAAYWLGFLYADGCVREERNHFQLKLKDRDQLQAFKKFIQYDGDIKTIIEKKSNKTYILYQISFDDDILTKKLADLGCIPNKTYFLKFPTQEQLSPKYYGHFLRGVFDGDGSIFISKTIIIIDITGTNDFLSGIREVLVKNNILSPERSYIYKAHSKNPNIGRLSIGKKESVKRFYDFVYQGDPKYYLGRKKERFEELLRKKEE